MLVLDTNILLLDHQNLLTLGKDTSICIPSVVLHEMDSKKTLMNELGYQARSFGKLLAKAEVIVIDRRGDAVITTLHLDGVKIKVTRLVEYDIEPDGHSDNDQKIVATALYMSKLDDVTFMSNDVLARLDALAKGLDVTDYKEVDDVKAEFVKEFEISDDEIFRTLHGKLVSEVDLDYKIENFNYKFTNPNTAQVKLATVAKDIISVLGKDTERELRKQDINPANAEQLLLCKAIQDNTIDVVVCESLAGSGKTLIALSNAIKLVKLGKYDSILYVRASVNDVDQQEEVGFLPGLHEKFDVYLHPMHDSLDAIVRGKYNGGKLKGQELEDKVAEGIRSLVEDCNITAQTTLGMRGRTYNNTIMIVDEIQNQSKSSTVKVLTRVGKQSKLILLGSNNQIDNAYMTKYTNGLSVLLNACTKPQTVVNMYAITLHRVVRGPIAEWSEKLFSK